MLGAVTWQMEKTKLNFKKNKENSLFGGRVSLSDMWPQRDTKSAFICEGEMHIMEIPQIMELLFVSDKLASQFISLR